jgi:gluconate kinase
VKWVYLKATSRRSSRGWHPAADISCRHRCSSQFAALEEPAAAIVVDIRQSIADQVAQIASGLRATA